MLRVAAALSFAWAALLLGAKERVLVVENPSSLVSALANALGIAYAVLAFVFWHAARDPANNRSAIYGAILLFGLKTANDLYELLALVPADRALVSLGDLVLSIALLVGLLEALPRTLAPVQSE
jgi:hypothetical protein